MPAPGQPPPRLARCDPDWGWEFRAEEFVLARLAEDRDAAAALTDPVERAAASARVDGLARAAALHSIYVGADRWNWGRCYSCDPASGVPCVTIRALALMWAGHPDLPYPEDLAGWSHADVTAAGTFRRLNAPAETRT